MTLSIVRRLDTAAREGLNNSFSYVKINSAWMIMIMDISETDWPFVVSCLWFVRPRQILGRENILVGEFKRTGIN